MNELSMTIDVTSTLLRAESLFYRFQQTIEKVDRSTDEPKPVISTDLRELLSKEWAK